MISANTNKICIWAAWWRKSMRLKRRAEIQSWHLQLIKCCKTWPQVQQLNSKQIELGRKKLNKFVHVLDGGRVYRDKFQGTKLTSITGSKTILVLRDSDIFLNNSIKMWAIKHYTWMTIVGSELLRTPYHIKRLGNESDGKNERILYTWKLKENIHWPLLRIIEHYACRMSLIIIVVIMTTTRIREVAWAHV